MRIESYQFGRITVDGKTYHSDIIIYPDRIVSSWWRGEGHYLKKVDIEEILKMEPEVLIIGTGYSGVMKVDPEVLVELKRIGIAYHILPTPEAVKLFNQLGEGKVVAALHLTC